MRRGHLPRVGVLLGVLALGVTAGCAGPIGGAPVPAAMSRLRAACPLLSGADLAGALGGGDFRPEERPAEVNDDGTLFICVYHGSTLDVVLTASDAPKGKETPQRFVSTLSGTDPHAMRVTGVGDEATFIHTGFVHPSGDVRVLLGAAKTTTRFRGLTIALSRGSDESRQPLTELARTALSEL
ncbi:MAG: hypothetical protein ACRDQ5_08530 [Sciscionella sp.]